MELGKSSCATCAGLIRLCGGLDFFPADAEVRKLLVERLHRLARNHDHASAMIERWLETQTVAPKVADLVSLAATLRSGELGTLPAGCDVCNGELWVITDRGAKRCSCARGQALRAKEIENGVNVGSTYSARAYAAGASDFSVDRASPPAGVAGGRMVKAASVSITSEAELSARTRESTRREPSEAGLFASEREAHGRQQ